jgi:GntR family transcriptional regulator
MFAIDPDDPTPLYAQLERAIRVAIATGRLKATDQLPTVRQLAVDLRVNANTVAKVYGELERVGVLETRRGVGTFVRDASAGAASRPELARQLAALGDRFLAAAADLGYSAEEAIDFLKARRREGGHSDGIIRDGDERGSSDSGRAPPR